MVPIPLRSALNIVLSSVLGGSVIAYSDSEVAVAYGVAFAVVLSIAAVLHSMKLQRDLDAEIVSLRSSVDAVRGVVAEVQTEANRPTTEE